MIWRLKHSSFNTSTLSRIELIYSSTNHEHSTFQVYSPNKEATKRQDLKAIYIRVVKTQDRLKDFFNPSFYNEMLASTFAPSSFLKICDGSLGMRFDGPGMRLRLTLLVLDISSYQSPWIWLMSDGLTAHMIISMVTSFEPISATGYSSDLAGKATTN